MAKQVQFRRGSTADHAAFTGAVGEVTVDTDKDVPVVHDGATPGGRPAAAPHIPNTFSAPQIFAASVTLQEALEKGVPVNDNLASGDNNFDVLSGAIRLYLVAGDTNAGLNVRGDGSTTLNAFMADNQFLTIAAVLYHTGTAYYVNSIKIDGVTTDVTILWPDGTEPDAGTINGYDVYTLSIFKIDDAEYLVFAQKGGWAAP